jgi:cytoplasmic iron level regulating protein YaaA (DUF328/UPF0246 family)
MIILIHSSKTMKPTPASGFELSKPEFLKEATEVAEYLKSLNNKQIQSAMQVSAKLSTEISKIINGWSAVKNQGAAMFSFRGDVYSGLQVNDFSDSDISYANEHLRILSGLYGILRPLDSIAPYRLEMGYKLPKTKFSNLYKYWGDKLANSLPAGQPIINLTSAEYGKAVLPNLKSSEIIAPQFLSWDAKSKTYKTVAVHSKIARGAFAHWLIKHKLKDAGSLSKFIELSYQYDSNLSTELQPVFKCKIFGGKGLSVRLK